MVRIVRAVRKPRIVAIDPSLTSTGVAYGSGSDIRTTRLRANKLRGMDRLDFLLQETCSIIENINPELIVYEGYSMGSARRGKPGRFFDIGELGGILKMEVRRRNIPLLLVPPANLKIFICNNGQADKERMMRVLAERFGAEFPSSSDDEADAFGLFLLGQVHVGGLPALDFKYRSSVHLRALGGCELLLHSEGSR